MKKKMFDCIFLTGEVNIMTPLFNINMTFKNLVFKKKEVACSKAVTG